MSRSRIKVVAFVILYFAICQILKKDEIVYNFSFWINQIIGLIILSAFIVFVQEVIAKKTIRTPASEENGKLSEGVYKLAKEIASIDGFNLAKISLPDFELEWNYDYHLDIIGNKPIQFYDHKALAWGFAPSSQEHLLVSIDQFNVYSVKKLKTEKYKEGIHNISVKVEITRENLDAYLTKYADIFETKFGIKLEVKPTTLRNTPKGVIEVLTFWENNAVCGRAYFYDNNSVIVTMFPEAMIEKNMKK